MYIHVHICAYLLIYTSNLIPFHHSSVCPNHEGNHFEGWPARRGERLACRRDRPVPDTILTYDGESTRGSKLITYIWRRSTGEKRSRGNVPCKIQIHRNQPFEPRIIMWLNQQHNKMRKIFLGVKSIFFLLQAAGALLSKIFQMGWGKICWNIETNILWREGGRQMQTTMICLQPLITC